MKSFSQRVRTGAGLVAFVLVASSCGEDDGGVAEGKKTPDGGADAASGGGGAVGGSGGWATGGTAGSDAAAGGVAGAAGGGAGGAGGTGGTGGGDTGGTGGGGAGGTGGSGGSSAGGTGGGGGCSYQTVVQLPGAVFTPTDAKPKWNSVNLTGGKSARCIRATYTVDAPNNMDALIARYGGCPVFLHAGSLVAPAGELLVSYFRFRTANGCANRSGAFSCMCTGGGPSLSINSPIVPGASWKIVQEISELKGSTTKFFDKAGKLVATIPLTHTLGPDDTRDATLQFGLAKIYTQAYFPYYDAKLSDVTVEVDLGP